MFGGTVLVAPAASAAGAWRCYYQHYPYSVDTSQAGANWLRSTGAWICFYNGR
jgi:hypothetical protein